MRLVHRVVSKVQRTGETILSDVATLTRLGRQSYDVVFFSGAAIDEAWIRTTYDECVRRGLRCISVASAPRKAARAVSAEPASLNALRLLRAKALVTASSGLPAHARPLGCRHVIHMPHSLVSLHMVYPEDAFDHYNVLFACGDHHLEEIAAIDRMRSIRDRRVERVGYGRSDLLAQPRSPSVSTTPTVLIAPSWGAENVLESIGQELIASLLAAKRRVILRPHPVICHERPALVTRIRANFSTEPGFEFEAPGSSDRSLGEADVMVSDFSGIAMEFAFARNRPVIFVDVARKVRNPRYTALGITPIEIELRSRLGVVVPPTVEAICSHIEQSLAAPRDTSTIAELRDRYAYNWGCTGRAATAAIERLLG